MHLQSDDGRGQADNLRDRVYTNMQGDGGSVRRFLFGCTGNPMMFVPMPTTEKTEGSKERERGVFTAGWF